MAEEAGGDNRATKRPARRRSPIAAFLRETTIVVVAALVLSLVIKTFFAQAFYIPSISMQDTLQVGDRLVVNKLSPQVMDIERGDVVVFVDPGGWLTTGEPADPNLLQQVLTFIGILPEHADEHLIKRVIGT
ncbi:MAG TPA: signal peptidase I, partial [Beutenbergiaceae bacterium]|nr:signal peptidase I [Beutenbergiaceae bacterium]